MGRLVGRVVHANAADDSVLVRLEGSTILIERVRTGVDAPG